MNGLDSKSIGRAMKTHELRLDVTRAAGLPGRQELAATAYLPDALPSGEPPIVMFAIPGGGYARGYFDMHFPGHTAYSQAEHHTRAGLILIALDPLGVGASSIPDLEAVGLDMLADTYDLAVRAVLARLEEGTLAAGIGLVSKPCVVGIGQSMGGCITILTQGRHQSFDAIAPLGYSAIHTMLPQRTEADAARARATFTAGRGADLHEVSVAQTSTQIADYVYPFHFEDVPRDILEADMGGGYPLRKTVPPFGSATIPTCAVLMMSPGLVKREAAAIEVPVLVGVGERDVCPDPWAEPSAYRRSRDITLIVVPRMAHMHNFAGTRARLWERLLAWSRFVAHDKSSQAL
jgi:pimeloyl-ACP methyl ester carboxylesterase